jgi:hypothetical protein
MPPRASKAPCSDAAFERVIAAMRRFPEGATLAQLQLFAPMSIETLGKAVRVIATLEARGNKQGIYTLAHDWEERLAEYRSPVAPEVRAAIHVEGVCQDCTCKLKPSDFAMRDGRPYLPACPKAPVLGLPFSRRVVDATTVRIPELVDDTERRRRQVDRAVRVSDTALSTAELVQQTGLSERAVTEALATLVETGRVVRLVKTRAGRPSIAVFAMESTLPDPLRAS